MNPPVVLVRAEPTAGRYRLEQTADHPFFTLTLAEAGALLHPTAVDSSTPVQDQAAFACHLVPSPSPSSRGTDSCCSQQALGVMRSRWPWIKVTRAQILAANATSLSPAEHRLQESPAEPRTKPGAQLQPLRSASLPFRGHDLLPSNQGLSPDAQASRSQKTEPFLSPSPQVLLHTDSPARPTQSACRLGFGILM